MASPESPLADLYREVLLDHYHHPHNKRELPGAAFSGSARNPVCGDTVTLMLAVEDGRLDDVAFVGRGCAVSTASASMLTDVVRGLSKDDAQALSTAVYAMLKQGADPPPAGDLDALAGVTRVPGRTACALLPWGVLDRLLEEIDAGGRAT
jgi:nitrogen fixation NifU-like protein